MDFFEVKKYVNYLSSGSHKLNQPGLCNVARQQWWNIDIICQILELCLIWESSITAPLCSPVLYCTERRLFNCFAMGLK